MRSAPNGRTIVAKARDLYSASHKVARRGTKQAKSFIQAKPVLSILLGVASGIFLGMIFRSRA